MVGLKLQEILLELLEVIILLQEMELWGLQIIEQLEVVIEDQGFLTEDLELLTEDQVLLTEDQGLLTEDQV